jgi:predicted short-subunit dehydrogenase-like oxidoreductase (DUF2520 family)
MKPFSVSFIGSGNLAWHLAQALDNAGFAVREVYSQKEKNASALAERLYQCEPVTSLDFSLSVSRVFLIAVPDDAITEVVQNIILPSESVLVHTAGSQPLSVLEGSAASATGVFYPLQTFTRSRKVEFQDIPVFIEAEEEATARMLSFMAKALSKKVFQISSDERRALHVAAVFVSNFTNHMLTLGKDILVANNMRFDVMKPLIAETINKSLEIGPERAQTGPARRGDLEILDAHFAFLSFDPALAEIYKIISQNILNAYGDD